MAIGSVLTLIAVQIVPSFSSYLGEPSPSTMVTSRCSSTIVEQPERHQYLHQPSINEGPITSSIAGKSYIGDKTDQRQVHNKCDVDCLRKLTQKLISGALSSDLDWDLTSNNAQEIAWHLQENPDQIVELEANFSVMASPEERAAVLFIMSKLPKENLFELAQRLTRANTSQNRIAGLSLLESSIGSGINVTEELTQLINVETNENVLIQAIKIIDELASENIDLATQTRLSDLIEYHGNEQIVSAALLAKISIVTHDEEIRSNISSVLETQSDNLKLLGLQALDKVLSRQQYKPERGNWQQDNEFQEHVLTLANDVEANPAIRIEALRLMRRHFL